MSIALLGDKHYNKVENTLIDYMKGDNSSLYWSIRDYKIDKVNLLVDDWREDNHKSYGSKYEENMPIVRRYNGCLYKYNSPVEMYKALQCIQYQIEREEVEELGGTINEKSYKQLEGLIDDLASHIIRKLPEYDEADWFTE